MLFFDGQRMDIGEALSVSSKRLNMTSRIDFEKARTLLLNQVVIVGQRFQTKIQGCIPLEIPLYFLQERFSSLPTLKCYHVATKCPHRFAKVAYRFIDSIHAASCEAS